MAIMGWVVPPFTEVDFDGVQIPGEFSVCLLGNGDEVYAKPLQGSQICQFFTNPLTHLLNGEAIVDLCWEGAAQKNLAIGSAQFLVVGWERNSDFAKEGVMRA